MKEEKDMAPFIDLEDIHKQAFLELKGIGTEEVVGPDGRVRWRVSLTEHVQGLLMEYESNCVVPILNFVSVLKRTRGRMLDSRNRRNGHEYGGRNVGYSSR